MTLRTSLAPRTLAGAAACALAGLAGATPALGVTPGVAPGCIGSSAGATAAQPLAIPDNGAITQRLTVTGAQSVIRDVDVVTRIRHSYSGDLAVTLTSPAGTTVTLVRPTTRNTRRDFFNGTRWDDSAEVPISDASFAVAPGTSLVPEGALSAFVGEDPNGEWILTVADTVEDEPDPSADSASLDGWSLDIATQPSVPAVGTTRHADAAAAAIPDADPAGLERTITVAGARTYLTDVDVFTDIAHRFAGDLNVTLTSPSGTTVLLSSRNGERESFAGTTFDDSAFVEGTRRQRLVTDRTLYTGGVVTPLVPEAALGRFIGENPNGVWRLRIADVAEMDAGTLHRWSLTIAATDGCAGPAPTPDPGPPAPVGAVGTPAGPLPVPARCDRVAFRVRKAGVRTVTAGRRGLMRLSVRNTGAAIARGVTLRTRLPAGVRLLRVPQGATLRGRTLTVPLGALEANRSTPVVISFLARNGARGLKRSSVVVSDACGSRAVLPFTVRIRARR